MYDLPSLTKPISNAVIENVDEWEGNKMVVKKFKKKACSRQGRLSIYDDCYPDGVKPSTDIWICSYWSKARHHMKGIKKHQSFKIID